MKNKWFTLIEIIIIIAVFSIWIMAVFYLITNNLQKLDDTKTKNIATFLAKEWIELVFNARDANLAKELNRNCIFTDPQIINPLTQFCDWTFASGTLWKYLQIWLEPDQYPKFKWTNSNNFQDNKLYYHSWNIDWNTIFWYNHNNTDWQTTIFSRYIVLTWIIEGWQILPTDKIMKLESHVMFSKWSKTWEIVLESFIGEY